MDEWRRARAVLAYLNGKRVLDLVDTLGAAREHQPVAASL